MSDSEEEGLRATYGRDSYGRAVLVLVLVLVRIWHWFWYLLVLTSGRMRIN